MRKRKIRDLPPKAAENWGNHIYCKNLKKNTAADDRLFFKCLLKTLRKNLNKGFLQEFLAVYSAN